MSGVKNHFGFMFASCWGRTDTTNENLTSQIDVSKHLVYIDSVTAENTKHVWTSSFQDHLDHRFMVAIFSSKLTGERLRTI